MTPAFWGLVILVSVSVGVLTVAGLWAASVFLDRKEGR